MNAFEVYQTYLALKLHFTSDYDYFRYNGKVKADVKSFSGRKDKFFFEKLAKQNDPTGFILANIVADPTTYAKELAYDEQAKIIYRKWLKNKESLSYVFASEIKQLDPNFNKNFVCGSGYHPILLRLWLAERITLETLCIVCDITRCINYWDKQLKGDTFYDNSSLLIKKYTPFITYDKAKFKELLLKEAMAKQLS
jgi:hypothetical protein